METAPEMLTLVDIGSNAVRCLLIKFTSGKGFEVLRQERAQTRLGGGCPGVLPQDAIADTVEVVRYFLQDVQKETSIEKPPRVLAIATAAVRDAKNRNDFLQVLKRETGVSVRVLSGEEEAHLGALAALEQLGFYDGVVMDLGGGSMQLSQVCARGIYRTASAPLGVVRTTRRFFKNDPPTKWEILALREEVDQQVETFVPPVREGKALIGIGGTVRTLASMQIATLPGPRPTRQGFQLRRTDIARLRGRLENLSARERRRIVGLKEERADIILAGAVVIEQVMKLGDYETLAVCKDGVRHGLLLREVLHRAFANE
jgi:exopolyphosphatase/guanosine-5'-triphosphate,3'-diphosphate pyrophosphatase